MAEGPYPERILNTKTSNGKILYEVKWTGFDTTESTWEYLDYLLCEYSVAIINPLIQEYSNTHTSSHDVKLEDNSPIATLPTPPQSPCSSPIGNTSLTIPNSPIAKRTRSQLDIQEDIPQKNKKPRTEVQQPQRSPSPLKETENERSPSPDKLPEPQNEPCNNIDSDNNMGDSSCIVCHSGGGTEILCSVCKSSYHVDCIYSTKIPENTEQWKCFFCVEAPDCSRSGCDVTGANTISQCINCFRTFHDTCITGSVCGACASMPTTVDIINCVPTTDNIAVPERLFITKWNSQASMYAKGFWLYRYFPDVLQSFCEKEKLQTANNYISRRIITFRDVIKKNITNNQDINKNTSEIRERYYLVKSLTDTNRTYYWIHERHLSKSELELFSKQQLPTKEELEQLTNPSISESCKAVRESPPGKGFVILHKPEKTNPSQFACSLIGNRRTELELLPALIIVAKVKMEVWSSYLLQMIPSLKVVRFKDEEVEQDILATFGLGKKSKARVDVVIVNPTQLAKRPEIFARSWSYIFVDIRVANHLVPGVGILEEPNNIKLLQAKSKFIIITENHFIRCDKQRDLVSHMMKFLDPTNSTENPKIQELASRVVYPLNCNLDFRVPVTVIRCPLSQNQRRQYSDTVHFISNMVDPNNWQAIDTRRVIVNLQQTCNYLNSPESTYVVNSGKLQALQELLKRLIKENQKCLLLIQYDGDKGLCDGLYECLDSIKVNYHTFLPQSDKNHTDPSRLFIELILPRVNVILLSADQIPFDDVEKIPFDSIIVFDTCMFTPKNFSVLTKVLQTRRTFSFFQLIASNTIEEFAFALCSGDLKDISLWETKNSKEFTKKQSETEYSKNMNDQLDEIFKLGFRPMDDITSDSPIIPFTQDLSVTENQNSWYYLLHVAKERIVTDRTKLMQEWRKFLYNSLHMTILTQDELPVHVDQIQVQNIRTCISQTPQEYL